MGGPRAKTLRFLPFYVGLIALDLPQGLNPVLVSGFWVNK